MSFPWYLEMIKPAYQQPIDAKTYAETLGFFDILLKVLHPFMPFITEELWQALKKREDGESIMVSQLPSKQTINSEIIQDFEKVKEIIAGVRTIRLQKNIPNKDELELQIVGEHKTDFDAVINKLCNISSIKQLVEKDQGSISFLVGTTEYSVPLSHLIDVDEEIEKMEKEIVYLEGFLVSVMRKLDNERFVSNANPEIVEAERKKKADAESKIASLQEAIKAFKQ